jgi:hypothetical protein
LWDLGSKEKEQVDRALSLESFESIGIETFDDDADLQAKIWNRF